MISFLLILLIVSLLTSPTFSDVFLFISLFALGTEFFLRKKSAIEFEPLLFYPLILFAFIAVLSLLFAIIRGEAEVSRLLLFLRRFRHVLVAPVIMLSFLSLREWKLKWKIPAAVIGLVSLYAFYQHFTGIDLLRPPEHDYLRTFGGVTPYYTATGPFSHYITFGFVYSIATIFLLSFLFYMDLSWKKRILLLALTTFLFFAVFFSYARAAWLALPIGLCFIASLHSKRAFLLTVVILFFSIGTLFTFNETFRGRALAVKELLQGNSQQTEASFTTRFMVWKGAVEIFQNNPILGIGFGNYTARRLFLQERFPDIQLPDHPHNTYLQMLSDCGILGLLSFLLVIATALFVGFRAWIGLSPSIEKVLLSGSMGGLLIFLLFSLVDEPLMSSVKAKATWFCYGLIFAAAKRANLRKRSLLKS